MSDCIDSLIDQNVLTTLRTIVTPTYGTNIGTVERPRSVLSINGRYPFTLAIQLEPDEVEQWAQLRDDTLNYIIWYLDGQNDEGETANTEMSYRLRNVHADITKALKIDVSRGGYAQNTKIVKHGFGFFMDDVVCEPGAYVVVEIQRIIDPSDPYQLA
jgi:hypothetical protein